jgi:hypothetical protein
MHCDIKRYEAVKCVRCSGSGYENPYRISARCYVCGGVRIEPIPVGELEQ